MSKPRPHRRADRPGPRARGLDHRDLPGLGITADPPLTPDGAHQTIDLIAHGIGAPRPTWQNILVWIGWTLLALIALAAILIPLLTS